MHAILLGICACVLAHRALSQHHTAYGCIDRDYERRCLVGPGLGFVPGAKEAYTISGAKCGFSYSAIIGDLTGTYNTLHSESCSFLPKHLWVLQEGADLEFYTQFITNNVKCVPADAPPCENNPKSCEWEPCAVPQCVDLPFCDPSEVLTLGQPSWNNTQAASSASSAFVSTARELVWALRQEYIQVIEVQESLTLTRDDFNGLPAVVNRHVTVKPNNQEVQVVIAVEAQQVVDTMKQTAVVLVGEGGVLVFEELCTQGSLLYLESSFGTPRNLNTLPPGFLRGIAVMPGGEVRFVRSRIQSTDTEDTDIMGFSSSLYRVYSKVIQFVAGHASPKDKYSSNLSPTAFQYRDPHSAHVADLTVPVIFGGVHRFVNTVITRAGSGSCKPLATDTATSQPLPPPPAQDTPPAARISQVWSRVETLIVFVFIFLVWILIATICTFMKENVPKVEPKNTVEFSKFSQLAFEKQWIDADQGTILLALSEFTESAGHTLTVCEAFERVAKQSMAACLRRANQAYSMKIGSTTIDQFETYSAAMRQRQARPMSRVSMSITSTSMFMETLKDMQGSVIRAGGLVGNLAESWASRTITESDLMSLPSFDNSSRDAVILSIGNAAEAHYAHEDGTGMDEDAGSPEQPPESARQTTSITATDKQALACRMLEVGDMVTSATRSYLVQRMVGRGSTAVCFVAEDMESKVQVALKVPIQATAKIRKNLIDEANCMTRLKHPHIVKMVESFTFNGRYIIVLELCQLQDLQFMVNIARMGMGSLEPGGSLHIDFLGKVVLQLCLAVQHIHEQSIAHRDIKLSNIFLNNMMDVKLGDFGTSKVLEGFTHSFTGTPINMAPEVLLRKPYNLSSDMWSLGVVLYELCTLHTLFDVSNVESLIASQRGSHEHVMESLTENHSLELSDLVSKLLNTDPEKRLTANELMDHPFLIRQLQIAYKSKESDMHRLFPNEQLKSIDSIL